MQTKYSEARTDTQDVPKHQRQWQGLMPPESLLPLPSSQLSWRLGCLAGGNVAAPWPQFPQVEWTWAENCGLVRVLILNLTFSPSYFPLTDWMPRMERALKVAPQAEGGLGNSMRGDAAQRT